MIKTENDRLMLSSKCVACGNKKSRFMKEQEAKRLLSKLGIKTPLSKIPFLGDVLFEYKMNKTVNRFLLAGDRFMPEMHLRQPGFTFSVCEPFTNHKQRIQKFMQTRDLRNICKNKFDKTCFQHDAAYSDSKDLAKRTQSHKIFKQKAFEIAANPKYDGYEKE